MSHHQHLVDFLFALSLISLFRSLSQNVKSEGTGFVLDVCQLCTGAESRVKLTLGVSNIKW